MSANHIAQLNIGRFRYRDATIRAWRRSWTNLDRDQRARGAQRGIRLAAQRREQQRDRASRRSSDPTTAVNLSVWESVEALERFVWATVHKQFYNRKADWFEQLSRPHFVHVADRAPGIFPTLTKRMARLAHLTQEAATAISHSGGVTCRTSSYG